MTSDPTVEQSIGERRSDRLRRLVHPYRGRLGLLALVSFVGALAEAFFLVLVTAVAVALVAGIVVVGPVAGFSVDVDFALGLAAGVLLVRLALSLLGARLSARLTADATKDQRGHLGDSRFRQ